MGNRHTLIVFDFDDTLFPTTFITSNGYRDQPLLRSLAQRAIGIKRCRSSLDQSTV